MTITIQQEPADSPDAVQLVAELDAILTPLYPDENRHGYSVEKLLNQRVFFYVVRVNGEAAGCSGVQLFVEEEKRPFAEVKRMYVRPKFRGQGLGKRLLAQLEETAVSHNIDLMRLETGTFQVESIGLYEKVGYYRIPAFGHYQDTENTHSYEKEIVRE